MEWFATYGTLAALVDADDAEGARTAAATVMARHRRREIDLDDFDVRPATDADRRTFEAAKDGAPVSDLMVAEVADDQMSMFNQEG